MRNMLFGYALGHDAIARNPVGVTSRLRRAKATPRALTTDRIAATREAAAKVTERTRFTRAKRDGQVRGIIEDLLSSAMPRPTAQGPVAGPARNPCRRGTCGKAVAVDTILCIRFHGLGHACQRDRKHCGAGLPL